MELHNKRSVQQVWCGPRCTLCNRGSENVQSKNSKVAQITVKLHGKVTLMTILSSLSTLDLSLENTDFFAIHW